MASAAGLYFSGVISEFQGEAPKKLRAVKPEFVREEAPVVHKPDYTFFKTLNDLTMTQYVDLKGRLMPAALSPEKITVAPAKIKAIPSTLPVEKTEKSEPAVEPEKKQDPKPEIEKQPGYAVQVSSFRDEARAGALKMRLQENGFDAFLMQTELADHGGTWHRVFLGRYVDEKKAQEAASLARNDYKLNAVVVRKTN
jgi:cell division protein FtsN